MSIKQALAAAFPDHALDVWIDPLDSLTVGILVTVVDQPTTSAREVLLPAQPVYSHGPLRVGDQLAIHVPQCPLDWQEVQAEWGHAPAVQLDNDKVWEVITGQVEGL